MPVNLSGLLDDDDEFSELVSPNTPRADLVKAPANGAPGWLVMKQDAAGLLDEEFVRDLIAKAEPEQSGRERVTMPSGVTLSGSPGDIAAFIHKAAQDAREREQAVDVAKAEKSTKSINDLPDSDFAYIEPGGKKDGEGKTVPRSLRHFQIECPVRRMHECQPLGGLERPHLFAIEEHEARAAARRDAGGDDRCRAPAEALA